MSPKMKNGNSSNNTVNNKNDKNPTNKRIGIERSTTQGFFKKDKLSSINLPLIDLANQIRNISFGGRS